MIADPNLDRYLSIDSLENINSKINKVFTKIIIRANLINVSECSPETDLEEEAHQAKRTITNRAAKLMNAKLNFCLPLEEILANAVEQGFN